MKRTSLRSIAWPGFPLSTSHQGSCPRDNECPCHGPQSRSIPVKHNFASAFDNHNNYDNHEIDQMKNLQHSLDDFTDYEHYEKCCDGRHHGKLGQEGCCSGVGDNHLKIAQPYPEYFDDCDDCASEHKDCYEELDVCDDDDDCQQCEVECEERGHEPDDCPHDHPTTRDNCTPSCNATAAPLPQLGPTNDFDTHAVLGIIQEITPCTNACSVPMQASIPAISNPLAGLVFDNDMDHWQTFVQAHHCAPDPCMIGQPPQSRHPQHTNPAFGFTFCCDPTNPANHYPWQKQIPVCSVPLNTQSITSMRSPFGTQRPSPAASQKMSNFSTSSPSSDASTPVPANIAVPPAKICEWIMPCGSICGATYSRAEDLKKHIKNSHSTKGTVTCRWKTCTASFATEAALTGHISKKHLTVSDEEGAWKCTFPGCSKSFMYKQVRDDHVASHNGGNRMHCPICHQWLNCEGSNFKRHMASHGPKNEYMRCRFESFGCKKSFPRLDNLRRHETCCKYGKKAAGVHHHHHTIHVGHTD